MQFVGHILCMRKDQYPKIVLCWIPPGGKRKQGQPQKTWCQRLKEDSKFINISWDKVEDAANDRNHWKSLPAQ